ncbi:peptide-N4-asparagine amidase [Acidipila sp. EB88]|uniref:peptide-N4-asparagine amidase n=1 Tax=Acidipila sp. EB88 TaxID=2305226 RepID=UPI0013158D17|nr:peptide-N4-asparagine amidase [Acidipila sp. EB88]
MHIFPARRTSLLCVATALLSSCLFAQTPVPPTPVIGSSNPVTAEPPVKRPSTTPCTVSLLTNQQFTDFSSKPYSYTPPANCKGPWSKVVFSADFNVSAGRQYDRTAEFFLGGANIYFGTTAEPRTALSPSWHVERDVTNLSALLTSTQTGQANLFNFVGTSGGVDYTGIITGTAVLQFYPAGPNDPAPAEPDSVLPLSSTNASTSLNTTADRLTGTFPTLPKNVEGAYLELISQSQSGDEFWYTCSPSSVATQLENCGNTGFRETEVYVDGQPAGIAPVYPWIYTGGIDPSLWEPITGVQTLNFKPYLVDLTPFAGLLSNGQQHTVAIGVFNADSYFDVTGTLLLYLDHGGAQVTGAVTTNTLDAAPTPGVQADAPVDASGTTHATTLVSSVRNFQLGGYLNTSHGLVKTTINEQVHFGNYQQITFNNLVYTQNIAQVSTAYAVTDTVSGGVTAEKQQTSVYPFTFNYNSYENADGSGGLYVYAYQQDFEYLQQLLNGVPVLSSGSQEVVGSTDQYTLNPAGALVTRSINSNASYQSTDTLGHCYSRTLAATNLALTSFVDGASCGGTNKQ